jgi:hypothetical protein
MTWAQNESKEQLLKYANSLYKAKYIDEKEFNNLSEQINQAKRTNKNAILKFWIDRILKRPYEKQKGYLSEYELEKDIEKEGITSRGSGFFDNEVIKTTQRDIEKIYEIGLINKAQKEELLSKCVWKREKEKTSYFKGEFLIDTREVLHYLIEKNDYENSLQLPHFQEYINLLKTFKLSNEVNQNRLKEKIQSQSIKSNMEILSLLEGGLVVNVKTLANSQVVDYEDVFRQILALFPNLKLDKFEIKPPYRKKIDDFEITKYPAVLQVNGREYEADFSDINEFSFLHISWNILPIINKILIDWDVEKRICKINQTLTPLMEYTANELLELDPSNLKPKRVKKFGLMLVDKPTYKLLREPENSFQYTYFNPFWYKCELDKYPNPFKYLSKVQIENFVTQLKNIGLLSHLSEAQINAKVLESKRELFSSYEEIISFFDESISIWFDWEMSSDGKPYESAFIKFSQGTRGVFQPTDIVDEFSFNKSSSKIGFTWRGKQYHTTVETRGDWYDEAFLELMESALIDSKVDGKFYNLPDGGQASNHIFLSEKQYQFLKENNLIKFQSNNPFEETNEDDD